MSPPTSVDDDPGMPAGLNHKLKVDAGYAQRLERMCEKEELSLDIDPGALRRCRKPCPADLDGAQVLPVRPRSGLAERSASHRHPVPHPNLCEGSQPITGELGR